MRMPTSDIPLYLRLMQTKMIKLTVALCLVLLCFGEVAARFCPPAQTSLSTFNAAFVPFYPGLTGDPVFDDRASLLIQELQASDADIVCLQEIFPVDIQMRIYQSLRQTYPHILSAVDLTAQFDSQTPACSPEDVQTLGGCIQTQCPFTDPNVLFRCVPERCGTIQAGFSQQCRDCLTLYLAVRDITVCLSEPANRYDTTYGLMMLSRKELKNTAVSRFIPQSQFRGYLRASVDDVGTLFCTHLTGNLGSTYGGPPVPLQFSSYEEQHYRELETLFEQINGAEMPIVMGDFNHGPASPRHNVVYELPFHYGLMTARGFVSPYILSSGNCTFCASNPPVALSGFTSNIAIDHIYILTDSYNGRIISSERILDDAKTASGVPLSDHFGVKVTLKDVRFNCRWWENRQYYCPAPPSTQPLVLSDLQDSLVRLCEATTENTK